MCENLAIKTVPIIQEDVLAKSNELTLSLFKNPEITNKIDTLYILRFPKLEFSKVEAGDSYLKLYQLIKESKSRKII